MVKTIDERRTWLSYISLLIALGISVWSFLRSEQYRYESDTMLSQAYEVQWRSTQIREQLIRLNGYLQLADRVGDIDPDVTLQLKLADINVTQLMALDYVQKILPIKDIQKLDKVQNILNDKIAPLVLAGNNYAQAQQYMKEVQYYIYQVSGVAVAHSSILNQTAQINNNASRNRFLFAVGLALAAIVYVIIHQRYSFARRKDSHLRSFSSLFAHMTCSRITALRLFVDQQKVGISLNPDMIKAARNAALELEAINHCLLKIANSGQQSQHEALEPILRKISDQYHGRILIQIDDKAVTLRVPAMQFQLVVDELVQNAEAAVKENAEGKIIVRARVERFCFIGRIQLVVEVIDNGKGMDSDVLDKAILPFFSTKAGQHVGLGLTSCVQMIRSLNGVLSIKSKANEGTKVHISLPLCRNRVAIDLAANFPFLVRKKHSLID